MMTLAPTLPETRDPRGFGALVALHEGREVAFPLTSVRVRTEIAGDCARTVVEQSFANPLGAVLEAVHLFPLPEDGAVVDLELCVGDRVIRAEHRERKDAERVFAEAREQGHKAGLLTAERADIHTLRVTNLPPGESVRVRIVVVERLETIDGETRWRFPTVIPPRYLPGTATGHDGVGVLPNTDAVPDASRLQPPMRLAGGTPLDLEVHVAGPIAGVRSSLHAIRLDLDDGGMRLAPSATSTCDRDFVLAFKTRTAAVALHAWTDGKFTLVRVEPPIVARHVVPRDAVFVVDISGSMSGEKMVAAKRALTTALHGLSPGDRFALIAFDDHLERFRPELVVYDDAALTAADKWIDALHPRGGTEMLPALQAAFDGETPEGRVRTVLFVTDGQSQDEERLVAAVANRRRVARLFTLGIDTAVNGSLMKRLARVGGGVAELCAPSDDIEGVVARIEARFGSPVATEVVVSGGVAARPDAQTLFTGRPASFLVEGAPSVIAVTANTATGSVALSIVPARSSLPLGPLWARERITWLEDRLTLRPHEEEALRPEILATSLAHGVLSRFTALVVVDRATRTDGKPVEVVQPAELPAGWSESFRGAPPPSPPPGASGGGGMMRSVVVGAVGAIRSLAMAAPMPKKAKGRARLDAMEMEMEMEMEMARAPAPPMMAAAPSGAAREERAMADAKPADPASALARSQGADGSYGSDARRTAAAVLALILLGSTRSAGVRQRTVAKAFAWLELHAPAQARVVLTFLDRAEAGQAVAVDDVVRAFIDAGTEGALLRSVIDVTRG